MTKSTPLHKADNMPIQAISVGILLLIGSLGHAAAKKHNSESTSSVPSVIHVLVNTTAWFNWTHELTGDVYIQWIHFDVLQVKSQILMSYIRDEIIIFPTDTDTSERIQYLEIPGSATMSLSSVTSRDTGMYWVLVSSPNTTRDIFQHTTSLEILTEADFQTSVTINGVTFFLSMDVNGPNVTLHEEGLYIPTRFDIVINVSHSSPIPTSINVAHDLEGETFPAPPCRTNRICSREIKLYSDLSKNKRTDINIVLDFEVQGMDVMRISKTFLLKARKEEYKWIDTPGDISVMEHTTASFNWTHSIQYNVLKTWYYKESKNTPDLPDIAGYYVNQTTIRPIREPIPRLIYADYPGSMSFTLQNVTYADEGVYIARVSDLNVNFVDAFDDNEATLQVISASELQFMITMGGDTFNLCVAENGTDIQLPASIVRVPSHYSVIVDLTDPPTTPMIDVKYKMRNATQEETVCHGVSNRYERHIPLFEKYAFDTHVEFFIIIEYNVQNMGQILIRREVSLYRGHYQKFCSNNEACADYWSSRPRKINACAQDDVMFRWNFRAAILSEFTDILWSFRGLDTNAMLMEWNRESDSTYIYPIYRNRINYVEGNNAGFVLHNVTLDDSGWYFVNVGGVDIYDAAQLSVYTDDQLIPTVSIDNELVAFNSTISKPSSRVVFIVVSTFEGILANVTITVEGHIRKICRGASMCTHELDFREHSSSPVWIEFHLDHGVCGPYHGGIYIIGDASLPSSPVWKITAITVCTTLIFAIAAIIVVWIKQRRAQRHPGSNTSPNTDPVIFTSPSPDPEITSLLNPVDTGIMPREITDPESTTSPNPVDTGMMPREITDPESTTSPSPVDTGIMPREITDPERITLPSLVDTGVMPREITDPERITLPSIVDTGVMPREITDPERITLPSIDSGRIAWPNPGVLTFSPLNLGVRKSSSLNLGVRKSSSLNLAFDSEEASEYDSEEATDGFVL